MVYVPTFDKECLDWMISLTMGEAYDRSAIDVILRQLSDDSEKWRQMPNRQALFGAILDSLASAARRQLELKAIYIWLLFDLQLLLDGPLITSGESGLHRFGAELIEVDTNGFTEELFVTYAQVRARCMEPTILHDIEMALVSRTNRLVDTISRIRLIASIASIGTNDAKEVLYDLTGSFSLDYERRQAGLELLMMRDSRGNKFVCPPHLSDITKAGCWTQFAWSVYFDAEQAALVDDISNSPGWTRKIQTGIIVQNVANWKVDRHCVIDKAVKRSLDERFACQ
jgi:hypothetical protein